MKRTPTEKAYMTAIVENASAAGLVVIMFDLLVTDLKNAIMAMEAGDIEKRTEEMKHGFLILQQLQGSVDIEQGGDAAINFTNFYSAIRRSMMEAQVKQDSAILKRQIDLLLDVRQAWQQVATPAQTPASAPPTASGSPANANEEQTSSSWTA